MSYMYECTQNTNNNRMWALFLSFMFDQFIQNQKSMSYLQTELLLLSSAPQKIKQDDVLSQIMEHFRLQSLHLKPKSQNDCNTSFQSKIQNMLLIDVKTQGIVMPYNKVPVSFELQNPSLLNKLEKFVARQDSPFNSMLYIQYSQEFGVISRIVSLNRLRQNIYECILEGKAFCKIEEDHIEEVVSEMDEEYFYRTCKVKQIIESSNINANELSGCIALFKQIKDDDILKKLYRQIDHKVFLHANDPPAIIYSILGVLDIQKQKKYKIITSFNENLKVEQIKKKIAKVQHDVSYNVNGFLNINKDKNNAFLSILVFAILFFILVLINTQKSEEL